MSTECAYCEGTRERNTARGRVVCDRCEDDPREMLARLLRIAVPGGFDTDIMEVLTAHRVVVLAALGYERVGTWMANLVEPHYAPHEVHEHDRTCDQFPPCVPVFAAKDGTP